MLLDTNALSAWADGDPRLFHGVPMDRAWFVSTITLGEYRYGLLKSTRRLELERWLADFENEGAILVPDANTARGYARLRDMTTRTGQVMPYHDLWIAAIAVQNRMPLVSRDGHFDMIPEIRRISW